jgi:hypothetical protein
MSTAPTEVSTPCSMNEAFCSGVQPEPTQATALRSLM